MVMISLSLHIFAAVKDDRALRPKAIITVTENEKFSRIRKMDKID